jgi:hypothetical protein
VLVPAVPPLSIEFYAANVDRCDLRIGHHPDCLCFLLCRRGEEAGVMVRCLLVADGYRTCVHKHRVPMSIKQRIISEDLRARRTAFVSSLLQHVQWVGRRSPLLRD